MTVVVTPPSPAHAHEPPMQIASVSLSAIWRCLSEGGRFLTTSGCPFWSAEAVVGVIRQPPPSPLPPSPLPHAAAAGAASEPTAAVAAAEGAFSFSLRVDQDDDAKDDDAKRETTMTTRAATMIASEAWRQTLRGCILAVNHEYVERDEFAVEDNKNGLPPQEPLPTARRRRFVTISDHIAVIPPISGG